MSCVAVQCVDLNSTLIQSILVEDTDEAKERHERELSEIRHKYKEVLQIIVLDTPPHRDIEAYHVVQAVQNATELQEQTDTLTRENESLKSRLSQVRTHTRCELSMFVY